MGMFDATFAVLLCFSCCFVCIIACGSQENVMFVVLQYFSLVSEKAEKNHAAILRRMEAEFPH